MQDKQKSGLMGYLPTYYHDNTEMICITDAENPEIDELWEKIAAIKRNQFIVDADDYRIRQWEKLLRIRPDYTAQSLEYRKAVVIMRLSTRLPLVYRWLDEKIESIVGKRHHKIYLDFDGYWLTIKLTNDTLGLIGELRVYLREKIPANLGLGIIELFETWGDVLNRDYFTWGRVLSGQSWGSRLALNWGKARDMTVIGFLEPNTWHDIKTYIWQEDE